MNTAPTALKIPTETTVHGAKLTDDYAWLRDPGYPEVTDAAILDHLKAENAHFETHFEPLAPLVETIFQEMKGRIKEDDASVPSKDGDWYYWRAFETGGQYRKWWRRPVSGGPDELILDEPSLAAGKDYFRLGALTLSEDGHWLAYATDDDGSERFTVHIRDLVSGEHLPDAIPETMGALVWNADATALVYGQVNDQWRVDTVKLHRLGTPVADDVTLYHEADIGYQCGAGMTHDRQWIAVATGDNTTSEVRLLPADNPLADPLLVRGRQAGVEYDVETHGQTLFIVTNDIDPMFRLVTAPLSAPWDWTERLAPKPDFYLNDVSTFAGFFVVEGRENGLDQVEIHRYDGSGVTRIPFPEASYSAGLDENPEWDVTSLRLSYESMVTPSLTEEYDVATGARTTLKVQQIPSGYDKAKYATERLDLPARDGTMIPVSVVYPADFPKDGSRPLYLYGYGAYGIAIPPGFSTGRLSLLDRGFAFAIAHIRGGDDLGQQWQLDGKLDKRWNAFTDFVDVARGLCDAGFSSPGKLCAAGGSAGGELMGVVINTDPDLWGAVAAHVPFVDVLNTMLDESLPLTPGEWPEWGNPITDKAAFDLIRSYCPYQNVGAHSYPPLLVTAGLTDPRVTYWEPAKWVAKLRATRTNDAPLLLKTNMGAGHGGKSGRFESLRETAEEFAFFIEQMERA
ncbi:S9 family peptidase [Sphingomonas sp. SUN039]|uniref:S9 family peptidase n=1 Tax=Sphingomonas sp. SUN039 TaxID=2937787 RepID=UPI0021646675|nr:S9 family peptidase [Sphingomonas sp. SUN039]UVO55383.1 S9 family peptidase [Sphingomonas sp. SUN039]